MIGLNQTTIWPNGQVPIGFFCTPTNFIIQELKFCKILCSEVNLRGLKGNSKEKIPNLYFFSTI
jgi:hypothetical protein